MPQLHKPHLDQVEAYKAGTPIEELRQRLGREDIVKLNSNENLLGPPWKAIDVIREEAGRAFLYPDPLNMELRETISKKFNIPVECIVVHHGGEAIIELVNQAFFSATDEALTFHPTFPFFQISARVLNGKVRTIPMGENFTYHFESLIQALRPETKLVYLANPNNPTGTAFGADAFERLLAAAGDNRLVIHDEAYAEFAQRTDFPDAVGHVRKGRNVVVIRTFSKAYGLAALRIGYAIAPPHIASVMRKARMTFAASRIGQLAARAALLDEAYFDETMKMVGHGKAHVYAQLNRLGYRYIPSEANFVLIDAKRDCREMAHALQELGVVVRPIFDSYIRVTIGLPGHNNRFLEALEQVGAAASAV